MVRNNMKSYFLLLIIAVLSLQTMAADIRIKVEDSGSTQVDKLVLQLVSNRPAPYPSGYSDLTSDESVSAPYMTTQVSNAIVALKAMGPGIFPALVKHLRDDRYSFSEIFAAWDNLSVGQAVMEVLSDGHQMFSGYKSRKTPSGSAGYLSFASYVHAHEVDKWATWAKDKTRLAIQLDFIDWCVGKETERGFVDEAQRKRTIDTYEQARQKVRKQYSEPGGQAKRNRTSP